MCSRNGGDIDAKMPKKKKKVASDFRKTTLKSKSSVICRKGPLPMKLRALPRSFWQQPNKTLNVSPGFCYTDSPSSPFNKEGTDASAENEKSVSFANTDLLFSLFQKVENGHKSTNKSKRGRPKKEKSKALRDDDPYVCSGPTADLLPLLPAHKPSKQPVLRVQNERNLQETSDSPNDDHNYSQLLSQLVVQL